VENDIKPGESLIKVAQAMALSFCDMPVRLVLMHWETIERQLGYFGRHRDVRYSEYDLRFGRGQWRIAWCAGENMLGFDGVVMLYEDAYYAYLQKNQGVLNELASVASDVYDTDTGNVSSGLNYLRQEGSRTHLQDIAIRRCMLRFGLGFSGVQLIQIRDKDAAPPIHQLSLQLSPGRVPFHRPGWIQRPELEGWWQSGSAESFYQSNKLLQRRLDS
jgi:hypothetical protein